MPVLIVLTQTTLSFPTSILQSIKSSPLDTAWSWQEVKPRAEEESTCLPRPVAPMHQDEKVSAELHTYHHNFNRQALFKTICKEDTLISGLLAAVTPFPGPFAHRLTPFQDLHYKTTYIYINKGLKQQHTLLGSPKIFI